MADVDGRPTEVTEADWHAAQVSVLRIKRITMVASALVFAAVTLPAAALAGATFPHSANHLAVAAWDLVLLLPLTFGVLRLSQAQQRRTDTIVDALTHRLSEAYASSEREAAARAGESRLQHFEARVANALEMAEGEEEVIDVIERSISKTMPASRVQLLLADNSQAHLTRMVSVSPDGVHTGCGVDSPDRCPAARRAQIQRFDDSDGIDACPKLRAAHADPVAALCVPVSIMGRTVGVMHATGPVNQRFPDDDETRLAVLAKLGGARLGLVRVMAETELQATTDPLTGLLNRRSFEQHFTAARHGAETVLVAMADLDGFKALNDTFGHETGDRALRLFARVLSESIRARDLIGRHGGEEFIVCLPACPLRKGAEILDTLRERLAAAVTVAGLPTFTVSFGVVESSAGEELPDLRARADAALFAAKRAGRDRVVAHDSDGAVVEADGHGVEPRLPGREPLAGRP